MQVLYAWDISREPIEMLVESIAGQDLGHEPDHFAFVQALVYTTANHRAEADEIIRTHAQNWSLERIATLDLVILRIGISELLYFAEIPTKVTINEWVDIAKRFSTEKSGGFVNGMLDNILRELDKQNRIRKTGRGLIER